MSNDKDISTELDGSSETAETAAARAAWQHARRTLADDGTVATLSVSNEQTVVVTGTEPGALITFEVGSGYIVRECFHNRFPRPAELETAIAVVEDEIMRRWPLPTGPARLTAVDPVMREISRVAVPDGRPDAARSVDDVERLFSRLVAVAHGSPASHEDIPEDPAFAATLLILRELMHHWPVSSLQVLGNEEL